MAQGAPQPGEGVAQRQRLGAEEAGDQEAIHQSRADAQARAPGSASQRRAPAAGTFPHRGRHRSRCHRHGRRRTSRDCRLRRPDRHSCAAHPSSASDRRHRPAAPRHRGPGLRSASRRAAVAAKRPDMSPARSHAVRRQYHPVARVVRRRRARSEQDGFLRQPFRHGVAGDRQVRSLDHAIGTGLSGRFFPPPDRSPDRLRAPASKHTSISAAGLRPPARPPRK